MNPVNEKLKKGKNRSQNGMIVKREGYGGQNRVLLR